MSESVNPGIVRPARRPAGWCAPGPPPNVPSDRPEVWPRGGEDLCHLSGDWRILQEIGGHRWSLDDLVTAWFAAGQFPGDPPERILDLGCGIGAVLLMLAWRFPQARCTGIEAEGSSVALARRSLGWNGVEGRCRVLGGDLRDAVILPVGTAYDLVTGTPPYLPQGTATAPKRAQEAACHIEERGGIEAYCVAAARWMAPGALFVVCHATAQARRVEATACAAGLAIRCWLDVIPRAGKAPLFSVFAMQRSDAQRGAGVRLPELVVRDASGRRTQTFRELRGRMGMPP